MPVIRRAVYQTVEVELNDLITNLDRMLRRLIGEHVELVILTSSDLAAVQADLSQMEQVLTNLVVNARDAMPSGGRLTIRTRNVTLGDEATRIGPDLLVGEHVMITVTDTGVGMPEHIADRVFEPFFTTKEIGHGTGLGLSTCYGIVKQNGGQITVESQPGGGTTFTIYMPRVLSSPDSSPPSDDRADLLTGTETVLLVEDEPAVRNSTAKVLRNRGYIVLEASDGEEALKVIQSDASGAIDLLLTDVVMPAMGGRELATRFRLAYPEGKVLYMSGYPDAMVSDHDGLEPGTRFLRKPITMPELARKVRETLD